VQWRLSAGRWLLPSPCLMCGMFTTLAHRTGQCQCRIITARGVAVLGVGPLPPPRSPGRLLWIMQIRWENFHVPSPPPPTPNAPHEIWSVDSPANLWNCYQQMSDFKAKMHQIRFRLGLRPRPRWGSLQRSPRPPICI